MRPSQLLILVNCVLLTGASHVSSSPRNTNSEQYFETGVPLHQVPFQTSRLIRDSFPLEMRQLIMSFLNKTEIVLSLAPACHCTHDDFRYFVDLVVNDFMPYMKEVDKTFKTALFVRFLEFLKSQYPQLSTEPASLEDLAQLCYLHAENIKIGAAESESESESTVVVKGCPKMQKAAKVMLSSYNFSESCSRDENFEKGLFFTSDYYLANGIISQSNYYFRTMYCCRSANRTKFFERAAQFENPLQYLEGPLEIEFAAILVKQNPKSINEVVNAISLLYEISHSASVQLHSLLVQFPEILNGAIGKDAETFRDFLSIILKQLQGEDSDSSLTGYRYMLSMKQFDIVEFAAIVRPCLVNAVFLPMMNLNLHCHFEAFIHLLEDAKMDFSVPEFRNISICECMVASLVPEYWQLFCSRAKSFPPLHQNNCFFAKFSRMTPEMLTSLEPHLASVPNLLGVRLFVNMEMEMEDMVEGRDYRRIGLQTAYGILCAKLRRSDNVIVYTFEHFDWLNWILKVLSREQVAALDPSGRWSRLQYLMLLETFDPEEMARNVPYSLEAVLFIISMKLTNPAQLAAFAYLVSHPEADFSKPTHREFNMLKIIAASEISELWHLFCENARTMPPLRMDDKLVIDGKSLLSKRMLTTVSSLESLQNES